MAFPSSSVSMSQMNTERGLPSSTSVSINNTEVKQMAHQYTPGTTSVNLAQWRSKSGFSNQATFTIGYEQQTTASGPATPASSSYYWGYGYVGIAPFPSTGNDASELAMGRMPLMYPGGFATQLYNVAGGTRTSNPLLSLYQLRCNSSSIPGSSAGPWGPSTLFMEFRHQGINGGGTYPTTFTNAGWTSINITNPAYNVTYNRASATFGSYMGPFVISGTPIPGSASCSFSWTGQPAWANNVNNMYPFGPTPSGTFPSTGSTTNTITIT
tara:strand:- start:1866 stop:2672 length:807 start_codon:yes stop_codon:yes gene_type:complete